MYTVGIRKSTGAANYARWGLKLNASSYANLGNTGYILAGASTTDQAESGILTILIGSRVTSYLDSVQAFSKLSIAGGGGPSGGPNSAVNPPSTLGGLLTATITSVTLEAVVADALITCGADEMHVYTYATS